MATEINEKLLEKLTEIVKKNPGNSETFYSDKSGIPKTQILRYLVIAEVKADPKLKIAATGPAIKKAREAGVRWPRIAARTGISESAAKQLFEEHTGTNARDSYTGRGRNFAGTKPVSGASGRRGGTKSTGGAAAKKTAGASGRRGNAKKAMAARASRRGAKTTGRRGTRASAADPK